MGEKRKISTKVWKDRGKGRGFGYVSVRKDVLICPTNKQPRNTMLVSRLIKTPIFRATNREAVKTMWEGGEDIIGHNQKVQVFGTNGKTEKLEMFENYDRRKPDTDVYCYVFIFDIFISSDNLINDKGC